MLPISVVLVSAPASFTSAHPLAAADFAPASLEADRPDGRHVVLRDAHGSHHLWLPDPQAGMPLAALVPLDDAAPLRIAGLARFRRHLIGHPSGFKRQVAGYAAQRVARIVGCRPPQPTILATQYREPGRSPRGGRSFCFAGIVCCRSRNQLRLRHAGEEVSDSPR
ncbi:DUF7012 domain-containing protein [Dongia deserti]|uniref:DUF7012 domain-containing protein n=1 Tax=Dongia deserti TaxID=2268030 RepID=UPI003899237D